MNYIINADTYTYYTLEDFIEAYESGETGDTYLLLFAYVINDLFNKIKRRTGQRGKLARDPGGTSVIDDFKLTEDERDIFMDFLRSGSAEVFRQISGFSKLINSAFRFNVKFGDPEFSSTISEVDVTGLIISDLAVAPMTINAYQGMKLVIISPGLYENEEREIISNDEDSFTINAPFSGDVTDLEYAVIAQTNDYILIYSLFDVTKFDTNLLVGIDALYEKLFIGTVLKEWYLINRFMDDYIIEEKIFNDSISDLRMHYFQSMKPYRSVNNMLGSSDDDLINE